MFKEHVSELSKFDTSKNKTHKLKQNQNKIKMQSISTKHMESKIWLFPKAELLHPVSR